jgi:hypothetical protein
MIKELALAQVQQARTYTNGLLARIPHSEWLRLPPGGVSNVAWQVGHLAMAQYRLCLDRIRGPQPDDDSLVSASFLARYGRGSTPSDDPAGNSPIQEIVAVFDRVHQRVFLESAGWTDDDLQAATSQPHPYFSTKIDALWWCARHEMLHAGQIGLLRRLLGAPPVW